MFDFSAYLRGEIISFDEQYDQLDDIFGINVEELHGFTEEDNERVKSRSTDTVLREWNQVKDAILAQKWTFEHGPHFFKWENPNGRVLFAQRPDYLTKDAHYDDGFIFVYETKAGDLFTFFLSGGHPNLITNTTMYSNSHGFVNEATGLRYIRPEFIDNPKVDLNQGHLLKDLLVFLDYVLPHLIDYTHIPVDLEEILVTQKVYQYKPYIHHRMLANEIEQAKRARTTRAVDISAVDVDTDSFFE